MSLDLNSPNFTRADVVEASCVKPATLHMWLARHLISPAMESSGTGQRRLFSAFDAARLAVMKQLIECGISAGLASKMAATNPPEKWFAPDAVWEVYKGTSRRGWTIALFQADEMRERIDFAISKGFPVFFVPAGTIAASVFSKLQQIQGRGDAV